MKTFKKFVLCLIFRLVCFLITDTWFVPDEYFQSVEVGYGMVYGKSHLSWEWKQDPPLRSNIHPLSISLVYRLFKFFGADTNFIIRVIPSLLHSIVFAVSDVFYCILCQRIFFANPGGLLISMVLYFTNWFIIYCSSRTLANSVECALVIIALNWYPLYPDEAKKQVSVRLQKSFIPYMVLGTLSIIIRPTAVLIWGILGLFHLYRSHQKLSLLKTAFFSCSVPFLISIAIDSNFRFPLKFPLLSFAQFNFFSGGSAHFGVHPWYWYLIDGLLLTTTGMYFAAIGGFVFLLGYHLPRLQPKILFVTSMFYLLVHSLFIPHKEHRFMLPIIPLLLPFAAAFLKFMLLRKKKLTQVAIFFYVIINLVAAIFFCKFHQRGVLDAAYDMVHDISLRQQQHSQVHISQLTPCYSMPQYAYFHPLNVQHHMLDCTPNLKNVSNYIDESDLFHADPAQFLNDPANYKKFLLHRHSYAVIYKKTYQKVKSILNDAGYRIWRKYPHTIFPSSENQDTVLFVLKRSSNV